MPKAGHGYALNGDNLGDFGDFLLNDPFDTRFQSHLAHGTTAAGPGQPHFDHGTGDLYQIDAPAVFLQHGSYFCQGLLNFFTHLIFLQSGLIVGTESCRRKITYKRRGENKILSIFLNASVGNGIEILYCFQ